MAAFTIYSDFGAPQKWSLILFPHLFPMKWWDRMPWSSFSECWALSQLFHSPLFTFIKRLFSSSSLSAIRVVSSAYLRLLIFLMAILIPACASSGPAFLMMYSAYKLNKQGDSIEPWHTPFPIWNQSVVPCPVLTVASWPIFKVLAYCNTIIKSFRRNRNNKTVGRKDPKVNEKRLSKEISEN